MGALDGIKVLDAGLLVQGPQAAVMLGDWGADVVKIELPVIGDQSRWLPATQTDPRPPYFLACNRGKRSVTIDLRTPEGRETFLRLAERADVFISNFKSGTLESWGLSYEEVSARNPRIVYAAGSSFGTGGAGRGAHSSRGVSAARAPEPLRQRRHHRCRRRSARGDRLAARGLPLADRGDGRLQAMRTVHAQGVQGVEGPAARARRGLNAREPRL